MHGKITERKSANFIGLGLGFSKRQTVLIFVANIERERGGIFPAAFFTQAIFSLSSSQFHQHFTSAFFADILSSKKLWSQNVTREKLRKALLYKKLACKMLMESTPHSKMSILQLLLFFSSLSLCCSLKRRKMI